MTPTKQRIADALIAVAITIAVLVAWFSFLVSGGFGPRATAGVGFWK